MTLLATLAIWLGPQALASISEPQARAERPALSYPESAERRGAGYGPWVAHHEAGGGDRNVRLALRWVESLSVERSQATGLAQLDLIEGTVRVEVRGLSGTGWEVWLVDNRPGFRRTIAPEPGDGLRYVGRLQAEGEVSRVEARLGPHAFRVFETDLVVVARTGREPWTRGVLFGAPGLFQRYYTRIRTGRPAQSDEAAMILPRSSTN